MLLKQGTKGLKNAFQLEKNVWFKSNSDKMIINDLFPNVVGNIVLKEFKYDLQHKKKKSNWDLFKPLRKKSVYKKNLCYDNNALALKAKGNAFTQTLQKNASNKEI